jgi:hypothetical protein
MAKRRTGLQSEIAGIFSGVPVPKKGGPKSQPGSPPTKPEGSVVPKPVPPQPAAPRPMAPVTPMPQQPVTPLPEAPRPKVTEIKVPEQKIRQAPLKISRRRKDKLFASKAGVSPSRQKAGIILFILFSAALAIVLARPYLTSGRKTKTPRTVKPAEARNSARANIEIDWRIPSVYPANVRDPMVKGERPTTVVDTYYGLEVVGIVVSADLRQAIIGTKYVLEGNFVPGTKIRVKKINPDSVEFEEDGKTWIQKTREKQMIEGGRK